MADLPNQLLRRMDSLTAFPKSVRLVLQLTSDANIDPKALVNVIIHDPILTFRLLQTVNAPFFGLSETISSVNHAVVYIGFNTIKNLAIHTANRGVLPPLTSGGVDTALFHRHAITVAMLSRGLALHSGVEEPRTSEFFLAGLLHDIGKLALSSAYPEPYRIIQKMVAHEGISVVEAERAQLQTDHAEVGAALARHWHLPEMLADSIGAHHNPNSLLYGEQDEHTLMRDCVFVANQLATVMGLRESATLPNLTPMPEPVKARMGGDYQALAEAMQHVWHHREAALQYVQNAATY
ncbi:putative signal transduction protein [Magnetococcus marinus MC-1]|uniref:Putative signal transduction protein n=1 Tax=Magnetococcus marinus (strain ATCC BAA-1437 / JCM 17883 / MC-1) TaxID=156889 RepID=A0LCL1_MAGMM|nr:HDOD domain-containing protein [Magnetococcus marinus]ABK45704.1 putative signal transduction protein [Magnetococcus marinus MC-1]